MSDHSEDERSALARIEADLSADDPGLARRLRDARRQLPQGRQPAVSRQRPRPWMRRVAASFAELLRPEPNEDELIVDATGAVVVGCDGSPAGDAALRFAAAEARRRQVAMIVVVAFAEPIDPDNDDFDTPPAQQRDRARVRAERALQRALAEPPRHQVVAIAGLPGRVLAQRFPRAGLIVIGARRHHLLAPLTASESTEHLLAKRGRVPVVVVPAEWTG